MAGPSKEELIDKVLDEMTEADQPPEPVEPSPNDPEVMPPPAPGNHSPAPQSPMSRRTEIVDECRELARRMASDAQEFNERPEHTVEPRIELHKKGSLIRYGAMLVNQNGIDSRWLQKDERHL